MAIPFLQPPSTILMGQPGTGKTDALLTFIEAGLELFVIVTEPDGVVSLIDSCKRRGLDIEKLHWSTCQPATPGWTALDEMVHTISTMGFEKIQNIKEGVGKSDTREPAMKLLTQLKNFHCERTDRYYGPVDKWGPSYALTLDSLSGLSLISWMLTLGYKPAAHQGEWGVAMNFIEQLMLKITSDRQFFFCLTAHVEKEGDEITGGSKLMVSTLGRKLAPKIPKFFSDVVLSKRIITPEKKAAFLWSTIDVQCDLKNRNLPLSDTLMPTFVPIVRKYSERVKLAGVTPPTPQTEPKPQVVAPPKVQPAPMRPK